MAEIPTDPLNVAVNGIERASDGGSTVVTVSWMRPQNFDQFDIDCYDISVSSTSGVQNMTACGDITSTQITLTGNVQMNSDLTITVAARSLCNEIGIDGSYGKFSHCSV